MLIEDVVSNYVNARPNSRWGGDCQWRSGNVFCERVDYHTRSGAKLPFNVLYSYGRHFALAVSWLNGDGKWVLLKNGDTYSSSTSRHQWKLQRLSPDTPTVSFRALAQAISTVAALPARNTHPHTWICDSIASGNIELLSHRPDYNADVTHNTQTNEWTVSRWVSGEGLTVKPWERPSPYGMLTPDLYESDKHVAAGNTHLRSYHYHLLGAVLFRIGSTQWLGCLDERQYCFIELPVEVPGIDEAFQALKPQRVRSAEAAGQPVLRQGEWFFWPAPQNEAEDAWRQLQGNRRAKLEVYARRGPVRALPDERVRPQLPNRHACRWFSLHLPLTGQDLLFATGDVRHWWPTRNVLTREHRTLSLPTDADGAWWFAERSLELRSITVSGGRMGWD